MTDKKVPGTDKTPSSYQAIGDNVYRVAGRVHRDALTGRYVNKNSKRKDDMEDFSQYTPYEYCEAYQQGKITGQDLVDILSEWNYVPMPTTDGSGDDDPQILPDGTFEEVGRAFDNGLISGLIHDEILNRVALEDKVRFTPERLVIKELLAQLAAKKVSITKFIETMMRRGFTSTEAIERMNRLKDESYIDFDGHHNIVRHPSA